MPWAATKLSMQRSIDTSAGIGGSEPKIGMLTTMARLRAGTFFILVFSFIVHIPAPFPPLNAFFFCTAPRPRWGRAAFGTATDYFTSDPLSRQNAERSETVGHAKPAPRN